MKQKIKLFFLIVITFIINSCEPEYFDISRFKSPDNLAPIVYLPVSSGDYIVKDYVNIPESGNALVLTAQIKLDSIQYDLTGLAFQTAAVDSVFLIVKTINANPMQIQYAISFNGVVINSPVLPGGTLDLAGHVTAPSEKTTTFVLSNPEFKKLGEASGYTLLFTLSQPKVGPVIANDLKTGKISMMIACRASLKLLKL
ncbi:MAG TPA: hypothetical protein VIK10_05595 [Prolixibacteraceae bacterium]